MGGSEKVSASQTVTERYDSIRGFTNGFDYLRIFLAMAVVLNHSILTSYGNQFAGAIWLSWMRIFFAPILVMFFGLSGFLVSGSLKKNPTAASFMTLRAIRLMPALAVEVMLSALIIGPTFTAASLHEYFTSRSFWRYFTNVVGRIHMDLPGVFGGLPYPGVVNLSLWTVPYELECYLALIVLYLVGAIRRRSMLACIIVAGVALGTASAFSFWDQVAATSGPLPRALVVAFLTGVTLNLYADRIRLSKGLAALALAAMVAMTLDYRTIYLAVVPAVYVCVFLGMTRPPKRTILFTGDYSYGLYLLAFPIQQTYTSLFPDGRAWFLNEPIVICAGLLYASFSWWFVELPILSRKAKIIRVVENTRDRVLTRLGRRQHGHAEAIGRRVGGAQSSKSQRP